MVPGMGEASVAIDAQLQGAIALQASLSITPPTIAATLEALATFEASLVAAADLGLPQVSFDLDACASLIASINASYGFLAALGGLLGDQTVGVYAYTYTGAADAMGGEITAELGTEWPDGFPSSSPCTAIVLGAVDATSEAALSDFLGGA